MAKINVIHQDQSQDKTFIHNFTIINNYVFTLNTSQFYILLLELRTNYSTIILVSDFSSYIETFLPISNKEYRLPQDSLVQKMED